ncbi:immunity 70 family protein [Paenibacillus sp. YYML68]|uniref:immunity 70 family protein n=1 Tax=Paenibacillus sp. YYML68 TaxID=2909250 RepID=UPI0024928E95|nr:immunity 70 family protein [Paenibacillus sp. YYML68]
MAVGFKAGLLWYPVGQSDFLHSFFSTISYHLEPQGWGTRYPYLMNQLYYSKVHHKNLQLLLSEVVEVREKLKDYSPSQAIWDIEDLSKQPPWGNDISEEITSLENYFVTYDGKDLFDRFIRAIHEALELKLDLGIHES